MRQFWRRGSALGLLLLVGGCRDLDVPPPGPGVAPEVRFISPDVTTGSRVAQTLPVTLDAQDANGIRSLTLSCGATPLFNWTAPPFIATVDLRPCTAAAGADAGVVGITLVAHAVDGTGMEGSATAAVDVDASAPSVQLVLPERVAPGRPFSVLVKSDQALAGVPLVSVQGVAVEARALDANTFSATVPAAPGLGVDTWAAGTPPPLALLEELERPLDVSVEARGLNGNPAPRVISRTFVSRIAWERSIPGVALGPDNDGTELQQPVASAEGLVLPVHTSGRLPTEWVPVQFRALGGEVRTLPAELTGAGVVGRGIDLRGRVLLGNGNGVADQYYDFATGPAPLPAPLGTGNALPVAVGDELCFPAVTAASCTALELTCVRPGPLPARITTLASSIRRRELPTTMLASGGRVLLLGAVTPGFSGCCVGTSCAEEPEDLYADSDGGTGPVNLFPTATGQIIPPVTFALPLAGGAFALVSDSPGATQPTAVYRYGADRSVSRPWLDLRNVDPATGAPLTWQQLVSGVMPGEQLMTLAAPSATETSALRHAVGVAGAPQLLPAAVQLMRPAGSTPIASVPRSSAASTPNGLVVLLTTTGNVGALTSVDAAGRPRWVYRFEQDSAAMVVSAPGTDLVYFIDPVRQRVVALYP